MAIRGATPAARAAATAAEIQTLFADSLAQVPDYTIAIVVGNEAPLSGVDMKKITVTVSRGSESASQPGYRANYY